MRPLQRRQVSRSLSEEEISHDAAAACSPYSLPRDLRFRFSTSWANTEGDQLSVQGRGTAGERTNEAGTRRAAVGRALLGAARREVHALAAEVEVEDLAPALCVVRAVAREAGLDGAGGRAAVRWTGG